MSFPRAPLRLEQEIKQHKFLPETMLQKYIRKKQIPGECTVVYDELKLNTRDLFLINALNELIHRLNGTTQTFTCDVEERE